MTRLTELTYKFMIDDLTSDETEELHELRNDPETDSLFLEMTSPNWILTQVMKMYEINQDVAIEKFMIDHAELFAKD